MATQILTPERELEIRGLALERVMDIIPPKKIFETPTYFASGQDYASWVGDKDSYKEKIYKCHYLIMSYNGFTNSATKGPDDNPNIILSYNMQIFRQYQEQGKDAVTDAKLPNSHDLLVADELRVRAAYISDRDIIENKIVVMDFTQDGPMQVIREAPYIKNCIGDFLNCRLILEVNA